MDTYAKKVGFNLGNSSHKSSYTKAFTLDEIPEKVKFCVDGYGINSGTEVSAKVDGVVIGYLLPGGDVIDRGGNHSAITYNGALVMS